MKTLWTEKQKVSKRNFVDKNSISVTEHEITITEKWILNMNNIIDVHNLLFINYCHNVSRGLDKWPSMQLLGYSLSVCNGYNHVQSGNDTGWVSSWVTLNLN